MQVCLNGKFVDISEAQLSVTDHGFLFGDGVYDTLRTFGGKEFQLDEHLCRLFGALEKMNMVLEYSKEDLKNFVREGIEMNKFQETRIRITVTRGSNNFKSEPKAVATLLIVFSEVKLLEDEYKVGVKVITTDCERALPGIKTISMAPVMVARGEMEKKGMFEVLLVNKSGFVTEGSVTNLFMVENSEVLTPGGDILDGTMRGLVLNWIEKTHSVRIENITVEDLLAADEVFVTNSINGIVPVVEINGVMIGKGKLGAVTQGLISKFECLNENQE